MAYKLTLTIIEDRIYTTVIKNSGDECYIIPDEDNRLYTKMEVYLGDEWSVIGEQATILRKNAELLDNYSFSLDVDKLYMHEDEEQIMVITDEKEINWTREAILSLIIKKIIINAKNRLHTQFFESIAFNIPEINFTIKSIISKAMNYIDFDLKKVHFFQFDDALQTFAQVHLTKNRTFPSVFIHVSFSKTYIIISKASNNTSIRTLNFGVNNLIDVVNNSTNNSEIPKTYMSLFLKKYFVDKQLSTDFSVPFFSGNDIMLLKPDETKLREVAKKLVNNIEISYSEMLLSECEGIAPNEIHFSGIMASLPTFQELFYKKFENVKLLFLEEAKKNALPYGAAYHHNLIKSDFLENENIGKHTLGKLGLITVADNYKNLKIIPVSEKIEFPLNKRIIVKTARNNQKQLFLVFAKYNVDSSDAVPVAQLMTHINEKIPMHSKITINFSINYKGEIAVKAQNFNKRNNYSTTLEYTSLYADSLNASIKESIRKLKIIQ